MAADAIDFAADAAAPPQDKLDLILHYARQVDRASEELAAITAQLKECQSRLENLTTKSLPDAMTAAGTRSFTLLDGRVITVEQEVHCGLAQHSAGEAFDWLRQTGNDSIIKHVVGVKFGKGQTEAAMLLLTELKEDFPNLELVDNSTIHPQTLKAFVKECIRDNVDIPEKPFGIFKINRATIRSPKS